jgi:hypothetical protein
MIRESTMINKLTASNDVKWSLIWITTTVVITSIHHIYRLGLEVLIPALIMTILPYMLMRRFQQTKSKVVLWVYGLFNALIFLWFGFIDGFLDHVIKALGLQNLTILPGGEAEVVQTVFSLWSPEAGNLFYEGTGVLTFIASLFAMYYLYKVVRTQPSA